MLLKKQRGWETLEHRAAPESVYLNRRSLLRGLGALSLGAAMPRPMPAGRGFPPPPRNEKYVIDRPLTPESVAVAYNNFYEFTTDVRRVRMMVNDFETDPWKLEVDGEVARPRVYDLDDLRGRFPLEERVYRMRCIEAWSIAVPWAGFPLAALLRDVEPTSKARYVAFETARRLKEMPGIAQQPHYPWPYREALRLDEAMNELALLAVGLYGKPLPKQNGAPVRLAVPWKYGIKNIKSIVKIRLTKSRPRTLWNGSMGHEIGWYSNVDPERPHPRWSQATEKFLPTMETLPTQPYNGYGEFVAHLYDGSEY